MNRQITHNPEKSRFEVTIEGHTAIVEYRIEENALNIFHTYVPKELEGQGIAANLVKTAYEYADSQGLSRKADCSYAQVWLKRNPK